MCSLIFSTVPFKDVDAINKYTKYRGPDFTSVKEHNGYHYLHNLLSITGSFTIQPRIDNDKVILFNGEIYNYKDLGNYSCDTDSLIPLYEKYGVDFIKHLDGEFAIVLHDHKNKKLIVSTDIFGTKPLFLSTTHATGNQIGVGTYSSTLTANDFTNVKKIKANTTYIFDLETGSVDTRPVFTFDLNQHKTNFDAWVLAFERSITKRASNGNSRIFIGLSSGYDSGAIACEMNKQQLEYKAYSVTGRENMNILSQRYKTTKDVVVTTISPEDRERAHQYLIDHTEDWKYTIRSSRSDYNEYGLSLWDDNGANHLSHVCSLAKGDGRKILLSGGGADEILSDYGFAGKSKYSHSNFGGLFPADLKTIFPWPSFFESSMESYLAKDEWCGGAYSEEVRYPFLDKAVVQEFLWLTSDLKNSAYKAPLDHYLSTNQYPFSKEEKIGF